MIILKKKKNNKILNNPCLQLNKNFNQVRIAQPNKNQQFRMAREQIEKMIVMVSTRNLLLKEFQMEEVLTIKFLNANRF